MHFECNLPLKISVENMPFVDVVESCAELDKPVQYLLLFYWCVFVRFYVTREITTYSTATKSSVLEL